MPHPADLLAQQDERQREAAALVADLGLLDRLEAIGAPVQVGSAALGVMVRRDLDLTVICPALDESTHAAIAHLGADLALDDRVRQVVIRDDTGAWNTDPRYPDGLYLGVEARSEGGDTWNLDLWFVDAPERQPDLAHLRELLPRMTDEHRAAIVAIKQARASRPEHRSTTSSYDVYRAVVDDGVRTVDEFDRWAARSSPSGAASTS